MGSLVHEEPGADGASLVRVTYGEETASDAPSLDLALLYRSLYPCEPDHELASACAARGVRFRRRTQAVSVGELLVCVLDDASGLDREILQLVAYLCGGAARDVLLGIVGVPGGPERPAVGADGSGASGERDRSPKPLPAWERPEDVLGERGILSRELPTHEVRPGQLEMAERVADVLRAGGALCVEAGPGTGKTFAYLVPLLAHLARNKGARAIVCTRTKQLQEQVFRQDLPFLMSRVASPASTALLKGRENYLCLRRWETLVREMSEGLERDRLALLAPLGRWVFDTSTGDIEENSAFLAQDGAREIWARLGDTPTTCSGSFCPHVDECFSIRARRQARKADLVIVNHSLLLGDAAAGHTVLGRYDCLIVDEAHAFESAARLAFTSTLSEARVEAVADALGPGRGGRRHGWFDRLPMPAGETPWGRAIEASALARAQAARLLHAIGVRVGESRRGRMPDLSGAAVELGALRSALGRWELVVEETIEGLDDDPDLAREGEGGLAALHELDHACEALATPAEDNNVHWYEREFGRLALHVTPLDVAPILVDRVFDGLESTVLTSATLSLAGDFQYLDESLGLSRAYPRVVTSVVESPFAYGELMRILTPADFPPVSADADAYSEALARLLVDLHGELGRNGLVLFTSYELLFDVRERICQLVPTLAQGIDGSRSSLLERFRRGRGGCLLLGTDSFWEGVDLPGEELEYVVVTRLPFAVPTDPVFAALSQSVERRGRDAFMHLALPQAVLRLRQGVGRLIRSSSDRGVVIITDERIRTKPYGRRFADALPVRVERAASSSEVVHEAAAWFARRERRGSHAGTDSSAN